MIFVTGDTHRDFTRFNKKELFRRRWNPTKDDYVIVCGDFGLLWAKDKELYYYLECMERWPFTILWVQGNHENYDMIEEYPIEEWNGGKVRHILRDKVILLERGQVFNIEGKRFFTFGGAACHDVQGGILDRNDLDFEYDYRKALRRNLPFRILGESWWKQELPTEEEMEEGLKNLEKVNYKVDYIITHCASDRTQEAVLKSYRFWGLYGNTYETNVLTHYLDTLETKVDFKKWYFGHYHDNRKIDEKHTLLYERIEVIE